MLAPLDTPYADSRADALSFALGLPRLDALAVRTVECGALAVELRLLGASHQVVAGPVSETVACLPGDPGPLPASMRADLSGWAYDFTAATVDHDDEGAFARAVQDLCGRLAGREDALVGTFPGAPHAVTALVLDQEQSRASKLEQKEGRALEHREAGGGRGGGAPPPQDTRTPRAARRTAASGAAGLADLARLPPDPGDRHDTDPGGERAMSARSKRNTRMREKRARQQKAAMIGGSVLAGLGALVLVLALFAGKASPKGWIGDNYTRVSADTYRSGKPPLAVAGTIANKYKTDDRIYTPSGIYLRYHNAIIGIRPDGRGSKITVDPPRRGYARYHSTVGGVWGGPSGRSASFRGGGPGGGGK